MPTSFILMELTEKEIKELEEGMQEGIRRLIPNAIVKITIPIAEDFIE